MRRAQTDAGSQPVRNLAGNPAFVSTSGTVNVRTNLLDYPNFETAGTTAILRTNLCVNPRGVNAFSGYGTQTITPNVAVATNPDGITTANRVSYLANAANPGVLLVNSVTSGTVYTISAWVYHETIPAAGSQAFAQAGITSQPSPPAFVQGVWQRQSWIAYAASGTSSLGFRVSTPTTDGSFLITGVLVEAAGYVGSFFDGATSGAGTITYTWAGTANNSISDQRSPVVAGWTNRWFGATGGAGVAWQSGSVPAGGSWFYRKLWKYANTGPAADTGLNSTTKFPVTVGATYTASASTRCSIAGQHNSIFFTWYDAANASLGNSSYTDAVTMTTANTWYRSSYSAVAPANAVTAVVNIGPYMNAQPMPAGTTWDCDLAMVEQMPTLGDYFDGSTAAAGDFTYGWSGTANASTSTQRAPAIPFVGASKSTSAGFVDSKFWGYQSTAEDGKKVLKYWSPAGTPNSSWRVASINGNSTQGWDVSKIKAGGQYTFWMRYRTSGWGAGQNFNMQIADGTGLNQVVGNTAALPLNTTGWQELRRTFTALQDATTNSQIYMGLPTTPQATTDGVLEIREWMLVGGTYTGDFINPTQNTLSKWDGTANASTSVGYPPQLLDIAGKPSVDLTGPTTTGGVAIPVDPFAARTIYICYEVYGSGGNYPSVFNYGIAASKGFIMQMDAVGGTNIAPRLDFPGGDSNKTLGMTGGRTSRIHVYAIALNQGLTSVSRCLNGGTDSTSALNPGTGWDDGRAAGISTADAKPLRSFVFYADHDRTTRLAISRYLGNKYGAYVV